MLKKHIKNNILRHTIEWLIAIGFSIVASAIIINFIARPANVFGESMFPTLSHNDKIIINKLSYRLGQPKYGDIIAFPYKADTSKHFIKRVVGMPGDIIDFVEGSLYINNEKYEDEFSKGSFWSSGNISYPLTVPPDSYFVLGDNRNRSEDSRYADVGCISINDIEGKASLRMLPLTDFGFIR